MPRWIHRLHRSRRARNVTLGALGISLLGSCAGAMVANYTVAGMNMRPYTSDQFARSDAIEAEPEWLRDASMAVTGDTDSSTGFSSEATDAYSDARY